MEKIGKKIIAYFCMEFAFNDQIPNYAGGLGVLAADIIYSAADRGMPMAGVTLLYHQHNDSQKAFCPEKFMSKAKPTVTVQIENRQVEIGIWKMEVKGLTGHKVPVYFLSTNLSENEPRDRDLTKNLYAKDAYTRLGQEMILGIGGVKALVALGYDVKCFHLNEGHSAFVALENLKKYSDDEVKTRSLCTFTTHTPLSSGHDYFDYKLAYKTSGQYLPPNVKQLSLDKNLGMTQLSLSLSRKANAVSKIHQAVCEKMFPNFQFEHITNGIYHRRWVGQHVKKLFDKHIADWQTNPADLKSAVLALPTAKINIAKRKEKKDLILWLNKHQEFYPLPKVTPNDFFDENILTIGFARRLVPYKRASLIFHDLARLKDIGSNKLQLVFAGYSHENDQFSHQIVETINRVANELRQQIKIAFIPFYDLDITQHLVAGCDVWLNNPIMGSEASGTSGMKSALNGTLNLSILDGWWAEAFESDALCGWGFGKFTNAAPSDKADSKQLLDCLTDVINCYYNRQPEWLERIKHSIALISYFNTNRVIDEYDKKMWRPA